MIDDRRSPGAAWRALGLLFFCWALAVLGTRPPTALGPEAPPDQFSAARARAVLGRVLAPGKPHPVGSVENAAVRGRIADEVRALGLATEDRTDFACNAWGSCATVRDLLVRVPAAAGRESAKAVLLAVHHDSVGAGPGAGDDGAGVAAVLETLRALRAGPPLARPLLVWIDDGEEMGLLGAEAFARQPEAASVGAVVNLEARGTAGQSLMFETRRDNAWVVAALARALPHPAMTSIFYTIYQYLPNDTDFSVFKRDGLQGANFAFVGEPTHYHTPLDDLAHLSLDTLQHQGENALAAVRAFAGADLEHQPTGDAVYFDVLSRFVVRWPAASTLPLALLALVLLWVASVRLRRSGALTWGGVALAALVWLGFVALAAGLAFGVARGVAALGGLPVTWVAQPEPILAAIWLVPALLGLCLAPPLVRRLGVAALWSGTWIAAGLVTLALAAMLPGVSYLLLVPALLAGLLGASGAGRGARLVPPAIAALLVFPLAWRLWDGMGAPLLAGIGVLVALVVAQLLGELGGRSRALLAIAAGGLLVAVVAAALVPPRSAERPEAGNLVLLDDRDRGAAAVLLLGGRGEGSPSLRAATTFTRPTTPQVPWLGRPALETAAARVDGAEPAADVTLVTETPRTVRLRLRSTDDAAFLRLYVPAAAGTSTVRVEGSELPASTARDAGPDRGDRFFTFHAVPPAGVLVELTLARPAEALLQQISFGLPPAAAKLRTAAGTELVPIGSGDVTVVQRKVRL